MSSLKFTPVPGPGWRFSRYSSQEQLLLAQFAGQAMQALMNLDGRPLSESEIASQSFDMAEAMVDEYRRRS